MGPDFTYYIFQQGGKDVAAMYQLLDDQLKHVIPPHWLSYVAVNSADEASAKAASLGGTVSRPPLDVGAHGRMAVIKDPAGRHLRDVAGRDHGGVGKRGEPGSLVWNELSSTDIKGGTAFYTRLFDWTTTIMSMPGMDYTVFEREGQGIGGGDAQITPEMGPMPSNWLPYFAVSDCDGTAALAGPARRSGRHAANRHPRCGPLCAAAGSGGGDVCDPVPEAGGRVENAVQREGVRGFPS